MEKEDGQSFGNIVLALHTAIARLTERTRGLFRPCTGSQGCILIPKGNESLLETQSTTLFTLTVKQYINSNWPGLKIIISDKLEWGAFRCHLPKGTWAVTDSMGNGTTFMVEQATEEPTKKEKNMECDSKPEVVCSLKAKVSAEEAAKRMDKFVVPLDSGITLTKFTEVIGYTGGDVRSLRKALAANHMTTVEYDGKKYIRYRDAMELLTAIYGKRPITAKDAKRLMGIVFKDKGLLAESR